jgi:hypothetical protein
VEGSQGFQQKNTTQLEVRKSQTMGGDFFVETGGKRNEMERRPLLTIVMSQ